LKRTDRQITKEQYKYLYPTIKKVPRMYGSPNIHKEDVLLRPTVDYTHTIGYKVYRELAEILQPLVGKTTPCSKFTGIGERN